MGEGAEVLGGPEGGLTVDRGLLLVWGGDRDTRGGHGEVQVREGQRVPRRWNQKVGTDQERLEVACWASGLPVPLAGMAAPTPVLQGEGSSPWVLDTCPLTCGSPEVRGEEGEVAEGGGGLDEAVGGRCPPQACFSMARDMPPSVSKRTPFPRERSRASWPEAPFSRWRSDRGYGAARGPGVAGVCLHTWRGLPGRWEC